MVKSESEETSIDFGIDKSEEQPSSVDSETNKELAYCDVGRSETAGRPNRTTVRLVLAVAAILALGLIIAAIVFYFAFEDSTERAVDVIPPPSQPTTSSPVFLPAPTREPNDSTDGFNGTSNRPSTNPSSGLTPQPTEPPTPQPTLSPTPSPTTISPTQPPEPTISPAPTTEPRCEWPDLSACGDTFEIHYNKIAGTIGTEIGLWTSLTALNVALNTLTGTLPTELGLLTNLRELGLSRNDFVGTIPTELGALTNLKEMWLNENRLWGPVPSELGRLSLLDKLSVYENSLDGSLASEIQALNRFYLRTVWLWDTALTGTISEALCSAAQVVIDCGEIRCPRCQNGSPCCESCLA